MDYAALPFEDVLRMVTEGLGLDTTRSRSQQAESFLKDLSDQLKELTEEGRHSALLRWLETTGRELEGRRLIEDFTIEAQRAYTAIYSARLTSSALRSSVSTQPHFRRVATIASSGSSTSVLAPSSSISDQTNSTKTTPNTSFETESSSEVSNGRYRNESALHLAADTGAGAEMARECSDARAPLKRKREQSDPRGVDTTTASSTGPPSLTSSGPPDETNKHERSGHAQVRTSMDDLSTTSHKLKNLPMSNFGTVGEECKMRSIEEAFGADVQRIRNSRDGDTACSFVLKADISTVRTSGKPLFRTDFAVKEAKLSTQLERRFGWKRFMYATLPYDSRDVAKSDRHLYRQQVVNWLTVPKAIFGCNWSAFYIKESKHVPATHAGWERGHDSKKIDKLIEVVFFATEGPDIEHVTLDRFVCSTLHLDDSRNLAQPCLKLFSRFEILLSRTAESITFDPAQFRFVQDSTPTEEHDSLELRRLSDSDKPIPYDLRRYDKDESMTDGNAMMSVGAALLICKTLGLTHLPTAFQGRILGAKGVWYVSAPYSTLNKTHTDVWIQVAKSQRKIFMDPATAHPTEVTFNLTAVNFKPRSADLHRDFLPILQDRGALYEDIALLHSEIVQTSVDTWIRAFQRPAELVQLLHARLGEKGPQHDKENFKPWLLPPAETALHLVENGFMPSDNRYLANSVLRTCVAALADDLTKFRIKCPGSTSMMGITDPLGVLEAHQVFFCFSKPFATGDGAGAICFLNEGDEVLLARDPTLRPSDIQKFVYSFKPELAHLQDVAVFSTKGRMPAAAKLQGGDLDGDVFAVIWEPSLSARFKNVPTPEPKPCAHFGVSRTTTITKDLVAIAGAERLVDRFMREAFQFRMQGSLLGLVTNFTNAFTYHKGLWDIQSIELADLHGYLIDSLKNGFMFSKEKWQVYLQESNLDPTMSAAWKDSQDKLKALLKPKSRSDDSRPLEERLRCFLSAQVRSTDDEQSPILDRLWFGKMLGETAFAIEKLSRSLAALGSEPIDRDLIGPRYAMGLHLKDGRPLRLLLTEVREGLIALLKDHQELPRYDAKQVVDKHEQLRAKLLQIPAPDCFTGGSNSLTDTAYSDWQIILATLLLRHEHDHSERRSVLWLATGVICFIKRHSKTGSKRVREIASTMRSKPHLVRRVATEYDNADAEDDEFPISSSLLAEPIWDE